MIDRREIIEAASSFSLLPGIVEKDYVLGWMLAGIYALEDLVDSWIFKGGTCLKKCYFETYRFSEDLDFTLRNEEHLDEEFLRTAFEEIVAWITEQSGLIIPADQLEFDIYNNARGRRIAKARSDIADRYHRLRVAGRRSSSTSPPMNGWSFPRSGVKSFIHTATALRPVSGRTAMPTKKRSAKNSAHSENAPDRAICTM